MATNDVIAELVRDLKPVQPLPLPQVRVAGWVVGSAVIIAVVTAALGQRADLITVAATPAFQVHVLLLALAAIGSAGTALALAVPGAPTTGWRRAAAPLAVSGWCLWLGAEVWWFAAAGGAWWPITAGWGCVAKAMTVSLIPGASLIAMIARAAPPDWPRTCLFAGLASAAVGALGVELICPMTNPMHLLLWHAGAAAVMVAVVTSNATLMTREFGGRRG